MESNLLICKNLIFLFLEISSDFHLQENRMLKTLAFGSYSPDVFVLCASSSFHLVASCTMYILGSFDGGGMEKGARNKDERKERETQRLFTCPVASKGGNRCGRLSARAGSS